MPSSPNESVSPKPRVLSAAAGWRAGAPCAVAVGNFDGVHLGHASIVAELRAVARRRSLPTTVLTFDPHPASILRPESAPPALTTPSRRAERLRLLGADAVAVLPVDRALLGLEPEAFYRRVLRGAVGAEAIVEGTDFRFGAHRSGDVATLRRLAAPEGVEVVAVDPVVVGDAPVSSSRIRAAIVAGDVRAAAVLLDAPHRIGGVVVHGRARGRTIGFPTANLSDVATLLPAGGVYAGRAWIAGEEPGFAAAVHVGPNVSFGATDVTVEVHLVGFDGDLYGRRIEVDFLSRLRDTRRFDSPDDLKAQLASDVARAAAGG